MATEVEAAGNKRRKPGFSKSRLIGAWQCQKMLYLARYQSDLAGPDPDKQAKMELGRSVGEIAKKKWRTADSVEVPYNEDATVMLAKTRELLDAGVSAPIFESTFAHDGVLIRADVMIPTPDGWEVIEVKSAKSVKEHYKFDCAIQLWVMRGAGLTVNSISVGYIDGGFVYGGDGNYSGLLTTEDVTEEAEALQGAVESLVARSRETLAGEMPEVPVSSHCEEPYKCEFRQVCWPYDAEYPVTGITGSKKDICNWINRGIEDIRDIPPEEITSAKRRRVYRLTCAGEAEVLPGAGSKLGDLDYPRYYLDFETAGPMIPVWKGFQPNQSVPVQWSCHIDDGTGDGSPESMEHREFLDLSGEPPMRPLAEALIDCLGESGPILMYTSVEQRVVLQLAEMYPDLREQLQRISERFEDLAPVVRENYYHPKMLGSWSIKKVAPAIAPHLDYADLEGINEGMAASNGYLEAIDPNTSPERKEQLREELLRYCKLDTEAMVEVVRHLERATERT
jgi:CRISPR/Cas system-associated exonuclease Cas4 (RecB family)